MLRKIKYQFIAVALVCAGAMQAQIASAGAEDCPDVKIIFARGSGAERWSNDNYETFRDELMAKIGNTARYEFEDLGYPAVGIGADNLNVLIGAAVSAGEAYEFGASVEEGAKMLAHEVNETCAATKYVVAGYSQGAMVVSKVLPELNPEKIIYAATFGDPKIYLPEGKGPIPDACLGRNFSEYREYVPDCMVYKGLLGGYVPYQPEGFSGKVGTWCNTTDIFCSTSLSISSHTAYVEDGLYAAASEKIVEKILAVADDTTEASADERDVMILFNINWRDKKFYDEYREAALAYGKNMLASGARVALYAAHTGDGGAAAGIKICDFDECTAEKLEKYFNDEIQIFGYYIDDNGGIINNILGAAFDAVARGDWRDETEKTLVIYSKEAYSNEARECTETLIDGNHSLKVIDGVVNLVAEPARVMAARKMTALSEASVAQELPEMEIINVVDDGDMVTVEFTNSGVRAVVIVNDVVLGVTTENKITIQDLDRSVTNIVQLVPLSETRRGNGAEVELAPIMLAVPNAGRQ